MNICDKFKEYNLDLAYHDNYFVLTKTKQVSDKLKEKVTSTLKALGYCYLPSENRLNGGLIAFSVTPYSLPAEFKIEEVTVSLTPEVLWRSIEAEKLRQTESDEMKETVQNFMSRIGLVNYFMLEMFDQCPPAGSALDLGSGVGGNSLPLLNRGWCVTAVDRYQEALKEYRQSAAPSSLERLTLVEADVTEHPLPKNQYDLVLATQLLNYLEPKSIRPLMQKIHDALLPGGKFIGTLWFENGKNVQAITKYGVFLYKKETAPALLVHSGFTIERCIPYFDDGMDYSTFATYQFIAKKVN